MQGILHADQSLAGLRTEFTAGIDDTPHWPMIELTMNSLFLCMIYCTGRLRDFALWELEHLVRALFKESEMRTFTLNHFRMGLAAASTTTPSSSSSTPQQ